MQGTDVNKERILELFEVDLERGLLINRKSRGRAKKGKEAGYNNSEGYRVVRIDYEDYYTHRILWLLKHGTWPDQVDHVNGIKGDNRIENLREASNSDNSCNKPAPNTNTSGFKGVSFHPHSGLWFAYACKDKVRVSAGYHKTAEAAGEAAKKLRESLHKQFTNHEPCLTKEVKSVDHR